MHKNIHFCDDLEQDYRKDLEDFLSEWESEDTLIVVQTSGSTGIPKRITLPKKAVRASAQATGRFFNFELGQVALLNLSPRYIAGKLMIVRALEFGLKLIVAPNTKNPLENLETTPIDFAAFVPYQVEAILNNPETKKKYEQIKNVIIGGAPVKPVLEDQLKVLDNHTYATFGMTETITHFALRSITEGHDFYQCLPGFTIDINENDALIIRANPVTTEFITTDRVERLSPTAFKWLGRLDNIVNSGGVKLSPEILEKQVAELFANNRFYFIGRLSGRFGEELVLYVESEGRIPNLDEQLAHKLTQYELPKEIVYVAAFEETATGKVIRKLL